MAIQRRPIVIGVFEESNQAQKAMSAPQQAGLKNDQVMFLQPGSSQSRLPQNLVEMGVPASELRSYEQEIASGRTIIVVMADNRQQDMLDILVHNGASNLTQQSNQERITDTEEGTRVPLREEQLHATKQTVQTGEAACPAQRDRQRATEHRCACHTRGSLHRTPPGRRAGLGHPHR